MEFKVIRMEIKKITKKEYIEMLKGLNRPYNVIETIWPSRFERDGVDAHDHDAVMEYVVKLIKANDERINKILTDHPQYCDVEVKSRDFIHITLNGERCWEQKKGKFYTFNYSGKLFILHEYAVGDYTIKASFIDKGGD